MFCAKDLSFAERICDESKKIPQMVGFLRIFDLVFGFKSQRGDLLKVIIHVEIKQLILNLIKT